MQEIVIVRTGGEIGIKSKPVRSSYERMILRSIKARLKADSIPYTKVWRIAGRIYLECRDSERAALSLSRLFGVSSTSPGVSTGSGLESILELGTRLARRSIKPGTFAIKCRRVGVHPYSSQDVCRALGKAVLASGISVRVDLEDPQQALNVEIRDDMAILYVKQYRGPDGFPLGAQEPALGIVDRSRESVIAGWCVMKRGSDLKTISATSAGSMELDKTVERNLRLLAAWKPRGAMTATIISVPEDLPPGLRAATLLSAASELARQRGTEAVISGLSPDLASLRRLMSLPVYPLFPLIAMDPALASAWTRTIGLEEGGPIRKVTVIPDLSEVAPVEDILASSTNVTIKA